MSDKEEVKSQARMLKRKEVAEMWGVTKRFIWKLSNLKSEADRLPSYKVGKCVLYNVDELAWYLDKHKTVHTQGEPK